MSANQMAAYDLWLNLLNKYLFHTKKAGNINKKIEDNYFVESSTFLSDMAYLQSTL